MIKQGNVFITDFFAAIEYIKNEEHIPFSTGKGVLYNF